MQASFSIDDSFLSQVTTIFGQGNIDGRVEDLLKQMTLQEKVNQLLIPEGSPDDLTKNYGTTGVGSYYVSAFGTNVVYRNQVQKYFMDNSRLHIPASFSQEALLSGATQGTIFPMPCGMSSTWNPDLVKAAHVVIAMEARAIGADRTFSPNINLYTDPRFGRYQEGWGEDPYLTSTMAVAAVTGLQGSVNPNGYYNYTHNIISEAKHFAAYGKTQAGQDGSEADVSERTLREIYLKPFEAVVKAGVGAIMPSHNVITHNGLPSHGNPWLLGKILREEWGFKGVVASDYGDVGGLAGYHLAANAEDAAVLALKAGVDMDLGGHAFALLVDAVQKGKVSMDVIDRSVRYTLGAKFASGLFDHPYTDESAKEILDNPKHRDLARQVAEESIVLLQNNNNALPLDITKLSSIAVIGPNANDASSQMGGYTNEGAHMTTILEGITNYATPHQISVKFSLGCFIMNGSEQLIPDAAKLASQSDVAIVVVGDNQDICQESWGGRIGDRTSLDLAGGQLSLIDAIIKTGKKTIVVLINGRPATFGTSTQNALLKGINALVVTWRPGEAGGTALANILFGDVSPSGKLISSWPFSVGQVGGPAQPYYTKFRQYDGRTYTFEPHTPLFPFGFGLSYTTFKYSNLVITPNKITSSSSVNISVTIQNTGIMAGAEVAQLYIGDEISSIVRIEKQLFGFQKVQLKPGQQQVVSFQVVASNLAFYDSEMKLVVEAGQFNVWVGGDSQSGLQGSFEVTSSQVKVLSSIRDNVL